MDSRILVDFLLSDSSYHTEGGFDLDMMYITENIIAMGFPSVDMYSVFFGYVKDGGGVPTTKVDRKWKLDLLYVANIKCKLFVLRGCMLYHYLKESAYSWLKEDIENVVVVQWKAGMARTGLMISSLLLYLKFFPTAEESIYYYYQKRCLDGKGLVLASQIVHA